MAVSDAEILRIFHEEGKRERAFSLLMEKYAERLYPVIRRILTDHHFADDVLQNTFLKAWRALPDFRADSMLMTWLYRIATNEALQFLRKEQRQGQWTELSEVEHMLAAREDFDGDEIQRKLEASVLLLPEKQKTVFILKYFEDLTYEQIAQITQTSVGALKASYHHAVKKIEKNLGGD